MEEIKECSQLRAKGYYYIILKLSYKIHNWINRLRVDYPLLNRPFIYGRTNMGPHMVKEGLTLRKVILKAHPDLHADLNRVLDKSGKIVQITQIQEWNEIYI